MDVARQALTAGVRIATLYLGVNCSYNVYRRLRSQSLDKFRAKVLQLTQHMNQLESMIKDSPSLRLVPIFETDQVEAEIDDPLQLLDCLLDLLIKYKIPKIEDNLAQFTSGNSKLSIKTFLIKKAVLDFQDRVDAIVYSLRKRDDLQNMDSAYSLKRESDQFQQIMKEFCEMIDTQNHINCPPTGLISF